VLDPAETVAGLHGALDRAALEVRLPAAALVTAFALVAALASLVWALRDKPVLLVASWSVLLGAAAIVYVVVPAVWRDAVPEAAAPAGSWPRCRTWTPWRAPSRRRRGPTFTAAPGRGPGGRLSP